MVFKCPQGLWNQMGVCLMSTVWGLGFRNPQEQGWPLHAILCVCPGSLLQLPGWGREEGAEALQQPAETWKPGSWQCQALPGHHDRSDLWTGERGFRGVLRGLPWHPFTHSFNSYFTGNLLCRPGGYSREQKIWKLDLALVRSSVLGQKSDSNINKIEKIQWGRGLVLGVCSGCNFHSKVTGKDPQRHAGTEGEWVMQMVEWGGGG